jgi:hypothetical protein
MSDYEQHMSDNKQHMSDQLPKLAKDGTRRGGRRPGQGRPRVGAGNGVRLAPATRERIRGAMLLRRLEQISMGEVEAQAHQVTAALGLLRFQLPTLQATDITSGGEKFIVERTTFKP